MSNGSFNPASLARTGTSNNGQKKVSASRLFMDMRDVVKGGDGFDYAVGTLVGKPDAEVRVRLTTVKERVGDVPGSSEEKVRGQYSTNSQHRESLDDKKKSGIRWLSFDDAIKMPVGEDGVQQYRAHWPKTIDTDPSAEIVSGVMHIRLTNAIEANGTQPFVKAKAYIEHLVGGVVATKDNVDEALFKAVSITDEQGRGVNPIAILRVIHDNKVVASPRLYPSRVEETIFDQAEGADKIIRVKAGADKTMADLLIGTEGSTANYTESMDLIRAVVAGLKGDEEPVIVSQDPAVRDNMLNYYYGAKEGHLKVEVVAAQRIDFGRDSGVTYLKDRDRPHLAAYRMEEPAGENKVNRSAGYVNTTVAIHRHPDGTPYATFASPNALWPKNFMAKLNDVKLDKLPTLGLEAEMAHVATGDAPEPVEQEVGVETGVEGDRYDMDNDGPG